MYAWSMPHILEEYLTTGCFTGDCKSLSTFFIGVASALDIPSRRVAGYIVLDKPIDHYIKLYGEHPEGLAENVGGHFWPEVYIPINSKEGFWIPVDPSIPIYKAFPSGDKVYHITVNMPHFKDSSTARIKVNYV